MLQESKPSGFKLGKFVRKVLGASCFVCSKPNATVLTLTDPTRTPSKRVLLNCHLATARCATSRLLLSHQINYCTAVILKWSIQHDSQRVEKAKIKIRVKQPVLVENLREKRKKSDVA